MRALLALALLACCPAAAAQILVVVHPANPLAELRREQLIDIYMGRRDTFPGGGAAQTFDYPPDSPVRAAFYQALVGKTLAEVNAYWARLRFGGRARPPTVLAPPDALLRKVGDMPAAIAYVEAAAHDGKTRIVAELK